MVSFEANYARFQRIMPWALRYNRIASFCCWLGTANNIALVVARPPFPMPVLLVLTFWWLPVGTVNLILQFVMTRWSLRLAAEYVRRHMETLR